MLFNDVLQERHRAAARVCLIARGLAYQYKARAAGIACAGVGLETEELGGKVGFCCIAYETGSGLAWSK